MNIDPELNYCPQCGDEYRADFPICAACEVKLVDGATRMAQLTGQVKPQSIQSLSPDDELVAIRKGSLLDIKRLQTILKEGGIPSLIIGEGGDCNKGCCGPEVLLSIRLEDGENASVVLAREFQNTTDLMSHDLTNIDAVFDSEAEQVTCPACGHCFSPTNSECPDCGLTFQAS